MFFYAQLDNDNVVVGVSQLSGVVEEPHMIELDEYDISLIGKTWTGEGFE